MKKFIEHSSPSAIFIDLSLNMVYNDQDRSMYLSSFHHSVELVGLNRKNNIFFFYSRVKSRQLSGNFANTRNFFFQTAEKGTKQYFQFACFQQRI